MTMDHWLTLQLHKNNHFYTKCFKDDTRQDRKGESDCEMSWEARPTTHITSCLWGTCATSVRGRVIHRYVN